MKGMLAIGLLSSILALPGHANSVPFAPNPPEIDGRLGDQEWSQVSWFPLNHLILGTQPTDNDFSGRYALQWDSRFLYLVAELEDDVLYDSHSDPLDRYWDDDCLEIFIDEDASGGEHEHNFNAFAYHIALDNQAVDIGPQHADGSTGFMLINEHITSRWQRSETAPHRIIWEVAIALHNDSFDPTHADPQHARVTLSEGKEIGFMLAYCDNDGSTEREHFVGSHAIQSVNGDKNLGYKNASVFGRIILSQ